MNPLSAPAFLERFFPKDESGLDQAALAFYFGFYFPDGFRAEKRLRAFAVLEDYWSLFGTQMHWMTHPRTFHWQDIPKDFKVKDWLDAYPTDDWVWQMIFHSGRSREEAAQYEVIGAGASLRTHKISYLYLSVAATAFADGSSPHPIQLYQRWAELLQAQHGTAGLGLMPPEDEVLKRKTRGIVRAFADMCPGVEIVDPLGQGGLALAGTLSPNWLTMVDTSNLDSLGGIEGLRRSLRDVDESIGFHLYDGGLILSAGEHPKLYENEEIRTPPKEYQIVARALKPIRSKVPWSFWGYGKNESLDWLGRLD